MFDRLPPHDTQDNWLELAWTIRLALATSSVADPAPRWDIVFTLATRERLATLAWVRSSQTIRQASPVVADLWRRHAMGAVEEGSAQTTELSRLLQSMEEHGVEPIVLKGHPLAVRLYDDPWVRPVSDVDLFIALPQRSSAHAFLLGQGWRHVKGWAPAEGVYQRSSGARLSNLEVHSRVLDDGLLFHYDLPEPSADVCRVDGRIMRSFGGPPLLVFLAAHLSKHSLVPLLWWVDFHTAWGKANDADRMAASRLADRCRLGGHFGWALAGTELLTRIASGPIAGAQSPLIKLRALHDRHNARRAFALASAPGDRLRVLLAWVWPPSLRGDLRQSVVATARRLLRKGRLVARHSRLQRTVRAGAVVLEVQRPDMLSIIREATANGGAVWVRARGSSMLPAIPCDAEVRLVRVPSGSVRAGDIVLALLPGGQPVIHRIEEVLPGGVRLRGDNVHRSDGVVPHDQVVALAETVRRNGALEPLTPGARGVISTAIKRAHARLARSASRV